MERHNGETQWRDTMERHNGETQPYVKRCVLRHSQHSNPMIGEDPRIEQSMALQWRGPKDPAASRHRDASSEAGKEALHPRG